MRRYFILIPSILLLITFFTQSGFAQEQDRDKNRTKERAEKSGKYKKFRFSIEKPTIELSYGLSDINLYGSSTNFIKPGMVELKLGFAKEYQSGYSKKVIDYDNNYLFVSNSTADISSQRNTTGTASNTWKWGFGKKEGMGLKFGSFSIMPYNANTFAWSRFSFDKNSVANPSDYDKFDNFNDAVRFGTSTEAGINFNITKGLSIQPKYEVADIYPRHLFGQQVLSSMIELGGAELLDNFVTKIMNNTPVAGAIVNFVLKNAYEYGIYELRKEHMNWPFTGEAPLRYSTFKMGMTFTF